MLRIYSGGDVETGLKELKERTETAAESAEGDVRAVIDRVAAEGDSALIQFTARFDQVELTPDRLRVEPDRIAAAEKTLDPDLKGALIRARDNIAAFHKKQLRDSWLDTEKDGTVRGQRFVPVDSVGIYVPGGLASYPSTVLMNAIPPQIAGVKRRAMVTPPGPDGEVSSTILAAAAITGIDEIYRVGGAQAVAALAIGTETISPVDKIVGPGNIYVALAKKILFGRVGIDMIAGPSEILVLADSSADPLYVACDMISQAEHDPLASAVLVSTDRELAEAVLRELNRETEASPRKDIVAKSLKDFGRVFLVESIEAGLEIVNRIAPEHLALQVRDPWEVMERVRNAGTIFVGNYTPEALGDYLAGLNHVLPTSGSARFASGLGVDDFLKRIQVLSYPAAAMEAAVDDVARLAEAEGLPGHARSARVRREKQIEEKR